MQKLKFEPINGYGVLVDEESDIREGDWAIEMYNGESQAITPLKFTDKNGNNWFVRKMNMNCGKNDPEAHKIIFTEKELNLEGIPVFEWRDFNIIKLAVENYKKQKTAPANTELIEPMKKYINGFIKGYKSNPAKYTEEDLRKLIIEIRTQLTKTGYNHYSIDYSKCIESLQKYPKYVVMESEEFYDEDDNMNIVKLLKLFTNSEGKQQGIIKELIWT